MSDTFRNILGKFGESVKTAYDAEQAFTPIQQEIQMQNTMLKAAPMINQLVAQSALGLAGGPDAVNSRVQQIVSEAGGDNLTAENSTAIMGRAKAMITQRIISYSGNKMLNQDAAIKAQVDAAGDEISNSLSSGHILIDDAMGMINAQKEALDKTPMDEATKSLVLNDMKAKAYSASVAQLAKSSVDQANALLELPDVRKTLNPSTYKTLQKVVEDRAKELSTNSFAGDKLNGLQQQIMTGNFDRQDVLSQAKTVSERQFLQDRLNTYDQIKSLSINDLTSLYYHANGIGDASRAQIFQDRIESLTKEAHVDPVSLAVNANATGFTPLDFNSSTLPLDVRYRAIHSDQMEKFLPTDPKQKVDTSRVFTNQELSDMTNVLAHGTAEQKKNILTSVGELYSLRGDTKELPPKILLAGMAQHYGGTYQLDGDSQNATPPSAQTVSKVSQFIKRSGIASNDNEIKNLATNIATSGGTDNADIALIKFFGNTSYQNLSTNYAYNKINMPTSNLQPLGDLYLDDGTQFNAKKKEIFPLSKVYAGKGQFYLKTPLVFGFFGEEQFVRDKLGNKVTVTVKTL